MDLSSLKDTVSNLTLYDLKAGVRKVQNGKHRHAMRYCPRDQLQWLMIFATAVMNYTEMESKVDNPLHAALCSM